jgi:hypothetical protein
VIKCDNSSDISIEEAKKKYAEAQSEQYNLRST